MSFKRIERKFKYVKPDRLTCAVAGHKAVSDVREQPVLIVVECHGSENSSELTSPILPFAFPARLTLRDNSLAAIDGRQTRSSRGIEIIKKTKKQNKTKEKVCDKNQVHRQCRRDERTAWSLQGWLARHRSGVRPEVNGSKLSRDVTRRRASPCAPRAVAIRDDTRTLSIERALEL